MKCPKCGYLGFEDVDRCRNCGYEFALARTDYSPDLTLRRKSQTLAPLDDLTLVDAASASRASATAHFDMVPEVDRVLGGAAAGVSRPGGGELPLFTDFLSTAVDDTPLITRASAPRPPLSVRRATPEVPRLRTQQPRLQALDLDADDRDGDPDEERAVSAGSRRGVTGHWPQARPEQLRTASVIARFIAVVIDLAVLFAIDAIVIYFTLRISGLALEELGVLPKGPLVAFLLLLNAGYFAAFTAGGQTLGKMATGIRVVGTESFGTLDAGQAVTRTVVWMLLAVPAGLGFLTLFSPERRGLHDRLAGTRVVRATA
jgi:uncharacterized RDD family membrane protein YckC